jgi:hypothetical protein
LFRRGDRRALGEAFSFIAAEKANYPVALMCRCLGLNRASFYRLGAPAAVRRGARGRLPDRRDQADPPGQPGRLGVAADPRRATDRARVPCRAKARGAADAQHRQLRAQRPLACSPRPTTSRPTQRPSQPKSKSKRPNNRRHPNRGKSRAASVKALLVSSGVGAGGALNRVQRARRGLCDSLRCKRQHSAPGAGRWLTAYAGSLTQERHCSASGNYQAQGGGRMGFMEYGAV